MISLNVPSSLKQPFHTYPPHNQDNGIEQEFGLFACTTRIDTNAVYVPIYWTNNYQSQSRQSGTCQLKAVPEVVDYVKSLKSEKQYFTVVQCDDGIYESIPDNLFIFGAGGQGDEPIPLTCSLHPVLQSEKTLLASFMGNFNAGGPITSSTPPQESSWDPKGAGARIRHKMREVFSGVQDCLVVPSTIGKSRVTEEYRRLAAKSWFGLAPRGYGKTSFRLYEMLSMGVIPVYIYDDPWLPYQDQINWTDFCVLCPEQALSGLPKLLRSLSGTWRRKAVENGQRLLISHFTTRGVCEQISRMVEKRWR